MDFNLEGERRSEVAERVDALLPTESLCGCGGAAHVYSLKRSRLSRAAMIDTTKSMVDSYSYQLVTLAILVAIFASYAALELAPRITEASGRVRLIWLAGGAMAIATGIWSMHYIGMLAFNLLAGTRSL